MYKRIIAIFMLLCMAFILYIPQPKAKADALSDVIKTVSGIGAGGAVVAAAPAVLALCTVAVLGGLVYENYDQISANMIDFYSYCETRDYNIQQEILANDTKVQISKSGIDMYRQYLQSINTDGFGQPIGVEVGSGVILSGQASPINVLVRYSVPSYPCKLRLYRNDPNNMLSISVSYLNDNPYGSVSLFPLFINVLEPGATSWASQYDFLNSTFDLNLAAEATHVRIKDNAGSLLGSIPIADAYDPFSVQFRPQAYTTPLSDNIFAAVYRMYDMTAPNVIGDRTLVNTNVTSQNPTTTLDTGLEITYPSATTIPQSTVVGQTATTVTQNPAITVATTTATTANPSLDVPQNISLNFQPLMKPIVDKFPFCIPFDLINLIRQLVAQKKAPVFHVEFPSNKFLGGGSFDIDLSIIAPIILIEKVFIILSFVLFLILKSRGLVRG